MWLAILFFDCKQQHGVSPNNFHLCCCFFWNRQSNMVTTLSAHTIAHPHTHTQSSFTRFIHINVYTYARTYAHTYIHLGGSLPRHIARDAEERCIRSFFHMHNTTHVAIVIVVTGLDCMTKWTVDSLSFFLTHTVFQPEWPELAKFRHFGLILLVFVYIFRAV